MSRLQITSRDFPSSEALNEAITAEFADLEQLHDRVTACHVTLGLPHQHKRHGKHFRVTVTLEIPGAELVVSRDAQGAHDHENAFAAVADAFHTLRRQLHDHLHRRRDLKRHLPARGAAHTALSEHA